MNNSFFSWIPYKVDACMDIEQLRDDMTCTFSNPQYSVEGIFVTKPPLYVVPIRYSHIIFFESFSLIQSVYIELCIQVYNIKELIIKLANYVYHRISVDITEVVNKISSQPCILLYFLPKHAVNSNRLRHWSRLC